MLGRRLIFVCLLVLLATAGAQKAEDDADNAPQEKDDDTDNAPQEKDDDTDNAPQEKDDDTENAPQEKDNDEENDQPKQPAFLGQPPPLTANNNSNTQVQTKQNEGQGQPNKANPSAGSPVNTENNRKDDQQQVKQDVSNNARILESPSTMSLLDSVECKVDLSKHCTLGIPKKMPNMRVLQCVDDLDNAVNLISIECQNLIYRFKHNLTHDLRFDNAAMKFCAQDIKLLTDCNDRTDERGTGRLVSCLYDSLANITTPSCREFINRVQVAVFSDWRLSEYFVTACLKDITDLKCGRLDDEKDNIPHEQGAVISCLSDSHKQLSADCAKQVSRLAEMQSDDYHLDRALYAACREDREHLCKSVSSGNGRVYRCLYEQKFNTMMSTACRAEVHRRQKMVSSNVLVDAPLLRACDSEMREHKCIADAKDANNELSLTNLLLCLEEQVKKGEHIKDECRREMLVHRRMLMSDYALSPQIISNCKTEMIQHCASFYPKNGDGKSGLRGGRIIHCLLGAARLEKTFSPACLAGIKNLVRAVDPGNDIRADPLLETACRPVIDALCSKTKPGDSNVILCLLENIKNNRMTEDCEDRLMEVSYFMSRDLRLSPRLLRVCRKNLESLCELPKDWSMTDKMSEVNVGQHLSCLYRQRQDLNRECRGQLTRMMRIRAQSIGLMPEIEENCMVDLATCKSSDVKGEEVKCLQQKYDKLEASCKSAIRNFTKMTISDTTLNFPLMKACESMIQQFCSNIDSGNENELLRCLIKHKNDQKMDTRCQAAVHQQQSISLKDEAFLTDQFRKKCGQEIDEHCAGKRTKAAVIQCLAGLIIRDVKNKQNQIYEECRDELKFEFLQRGENIEFDPLLGKACKQDIRKFCASQTPGNAQVLDCLKENSKKVSAACFTRLDRREKLDVIAPDNDYSLKTKCASIIQKHCSNEKNQNLLLCLRRIGNEDAMPNTCRTVLYHRLMILNSDVRFNKALIENCQTDIDRYCADEVIDDDDDDDDEESDDGDDDDEGEDNGTGTDSAYPDGTDYGTEVEDRDMGGRIIGCLRSKYANSDSQLETKCTTELIDVIQTSKLHIQLDVKLYQKCKPLLDSKCTGTDKEDCLKLLYQQKQIIDEECKTQVIRIIKEGRADIHVDPALTVACQADVLKYCNDIPIGDSKQLQCLLKMTATVTKDCKNVLLKRQELWSSISDVETIDDLTRHIVKSKNNKYFYIIFLSVTLLIFLSGCICRPCIRYRRVRKYK